MPVRGVRGATAKIENDAEAIMTGTQELLLEMLKANPQLRVEDIASAFFTATSDLTSCFPAAGARRLGWSQVPLMCAVEIPVTDGLSGCIRVLLHWNTDLTQMEIQHVYLREAKKLRPDLIQKNEGR